MFCSNCGNGMEKGNKFCSHCGADSSTRKNIQASSREDFLYSEDWTRVKPIAVFTVPHFDVLITKDHFYLIQLPNVHGGTIGTIIGLVILSIFGAIIGWLVGKSRDKGKRESFRSAWINSERQLISREYEQNVFLKISRSAVKENIAFKKNQLVIRVHGEKTITLKKSKKSLEQVKEYIESNVL